MATSWSIGMLNHHDCPSLKSTAMMSFGRLSLWGGVHYLRMVCSLPSDLQQVTVQTIDHSASMCSSVLNDPQTQFCAGVSGGGKGK